MKYKNYILIAILILAAVLRFYRLGDQPVLNADEAALGYNAYSLIETGKDEHGNSWPIHFQSFNDYKPGLYVYLVMPFVTVFGLDVFWIRFPGALLGVLSVGMIYLLIRELFSNRTLMANGRWLNNAKKESSAINHQLLAVIAGFLLAINPWHIHFSRGAWEVNVATFFMLAGVYSFLRWIKLSPPSFKKQIQTLPNLPLKRGGENSHPFQGGVVGHHSETAQSGPVWYLRGGLFSGILNKDIYSLLISTLFFVLSLYTYHSARVIAPLLGLGLSIIYFDYIKNNSKQVLMAVVFGIVLLIPLISDLAGPAGLSRASGVGLFADPGPVNRVNEQRGQHEDIDSVYARLLHNKAVNYGLAFAQNWSEHYHGEFLFLSGEDIQRNKVPETGQMYLFEIILIPLGIAFVIRRRLKSGVFILWWLVIAPVAAALTFQSPHALRSQNMVIPLIILSGLGLYFVNEFLRSDRSRFVTTVGKYLIVLIGFIIIWNFARYQHMYWVHMAKEYPFSSQYGVEQLVNYVKENKEVGQRVVVTDRYDQPYILFLFYMNYPPSQFQQEHTLTDRDKYGFSTVSEFGDYHFRSIDYNEVVENYPNAIIAGTDEEIPDEASIIDEIYGTNGYKYFKIVEN